ncbi:MAG: DEAD/DEAH box helicase [Spirochaetes bacterium]|nr:DEAD/DEAH box helicase [Spirochaetota bacterium]MBU1080446.1 DEAD/DEAH box helicase [Spirochaetota bacterium]
MQSRNSYQSSSRRGSSDERSSYAPRQPYAGQRRDRYSPQGSGYGGGRPSPRGGARAKQFIHPSRFIQAATVTEKAEYVPVHSFADFDVHRKILDNIALKGFEKPSAIQDQTIPLVLQGKDVVGIANTGTGKTAAFAIPMIHDLITHMDHRAIIIAPTRELAQQIMDECFSFGKGCGLRSALLIGGSSMGLQRRDLRYNPRVVIGTPGRIKDHIQQGTLPLSLFNFVVLDEVDRMLDMGFINDITGILSRVSPQRQSLFFSATMEPRIANLIKQFSNEPTTVSTKEGSTVDSVSQDVVYYSGGNDKLDKLHDVLIAGDCGKTIIFDETKRSVERLGRELSARGFKVDEIHGDKSQAQRSRALQRLKSDEINILVATDVAARGIDVSDITHVINFSTPNSYDDYVHRIGRTGRAGKTGIALTFLPR